ncbi:MAG TPA: hypothetical protein VJM33_14790 [Microthrixaceae bacterium]|nr:hypothetical protein [Microthrixaceae bacterium]
MRAAALALTLCLLVVAGCSDDDDPSSDADVDATSTTVATAAPIVFNGQGNHLDAYATEPDANGTFATQRVITGRDAVPASSADPDGTDINAQICFWPDGSGRFIAGEDTNQPDPPPGWGIFELHGAAPGSEDVAVGGLGARQVGKLTPTYQEGDNNAENYGCGIISGDRVLTTDIGNQALGPGTGQLIVWFGPFDTREVQYCKLDVALATAQSIYVGPDDEVLVASSRGDVYRYSPPFPTGPDAAGGCGKEDATGAPMADAVNKTTFVASGDHGLSTPAGIAAAADGGVYISSVFTGIINEYDADGVYRRTVLSPPAGETIGEKPYSTGTPLGIGTDRDGTLYYADIGIVATPGELPGPGAGTGTVRRIRFVDGEPQPPEVMGAGLAFPDGIGVFEPLSRGPG